MTTPALFDQIASNLRVKSDVSQVLACLEEFTSTFFSSKNAEEQQQIFRTLPKATADILINVLAKEPITTQNQITIKRQVDELTDKLRSCKSIQLTIAFQPDEKTITEFSDWIKKNVREDLLIDLQYDTSIVGGVLLIAGGIYKDYSVRKNLSNRFQLQREEIMGLLD